MDFYRFNKILRSPVSSKGKSTLEKIDCLKKVEIPGIVLTRFSEYGGNSGF